MSKHYLRPIKYREIILNLSLSETNLWEGGSLICLIGNLIISKVN